MEGQDPREVFSICIKSFSVLYCVVKIYVGINATAQEVFSICSKPLGVLNGVVRISVGINATAREVFSIALRNVNKSCY